METLPQIPGVTVRRRLAIGGMGELFLVDREGADGAAETAVLKRLLPGADEAHRALFAREGDVLAQLASPHIVRLLDRGPGWLLLEHVDGVDLATLLAHRARRGRPLPLPAAWALLGGLCEALADLHEATAADGTPLGLVHRDVNPANVLLTRGGAVKLIDLGVVRTALTDASTVAGVKGTLAYMAPEQLHGRPAGPAADLYAAGLVAYEVLTGVPARPQGAAVGLAELLAARERLPAVPSSLRARIPAAVDAVVLGALAPAPSARPATARAFGEALLAAGGEPDRASLADAVVRVAGEAEVAAPAPHRTLVAAAGGGGPGAPVATALGAQGEAPASVKPSRRRLVAVATALVVAAVAVVVGFVLPGEVTPPDPRPLTLTGAPPVDTFAEDADATETMPPADPDAAPSPDSTAPPDVSDTSAARVADVPRVVDSGAVAVAMEDAGPEPSDASPRLPDLRRPPTVHVREPGLILRVERRGEGWVHVVAGGHKGLAPQQSDPLADGDRLAVTLSDGALSLKARVTRRGKRLTASFSAADPSLRVSCGAHKAFVPTPAWALPLSCDAVDKAGAIIAFRLRAEAP